MRLWTGSLCEHSLVGANPNVSRLGFSWVSFLRQMFCFQWNVFSVFSCAMMWCVSLFIFNFYGAACLSSYLLSFEFLWRSMCAINRGCWCRSVSSRIYPWLTLVMFSRTRKIVRFARGKGSSMLLHIFGHKFCTKYAHSTFSVRS